MTILCAQMYNTIVTKLSRRNIQIHIFLKKECTVEMNFIAASFP